MSDIFKTIIQRWNTALSHCFAITGSGVQDMVELGLMFNNYIRRQLLAGDWDLIVFFDPAHGIRFPDKEAERVAAERAKQSGEKLAYTPMSLRAAQLLGLVQEQPSSTPFGGRSTGPLASVRQSSGDSDLSSVKDPVKALDLLDKLMRATLRDARTNETRPVKIAVVFENAQVTFPALGQPNPNYDLCGIHATTWATEAEWIDGSTAPLVLYIAPDREKLSPVLVGPESRVYSLEVTAPDDAGRESFAAQLFAPNAYGSAVKLDGVTPALFARLTAGLSRLQMEDIIVGCAQSETALTVEVLRDRKRELMKASYNGALFIEDPRIDFAQVAGHEEIKQYFDELAEALASGEGLEDLPRGLIFAGPPGTGKTMLAQAVAKRLGLNFSKLNLQSQKDMYVGNSEKNLRRALNLIETMTPIVVFIDELDTQFTSRDAGPTGSSVDGSLLGMFLEFMSDPKHVGKVIIIGATNRPDLIDAALLRPGRFDTLIPLLPGDAPNRETLLRLAAAERGKVWDKKIDFEPFLTRSEGWTQAELAMLFTQVCKEARRNNHTDKLMQADLDTAVRFIRPSTRQVQSWSQIAVRMCNDYRLLPPAWREIAEQTQDTDEAPILEPSTTPSENGLRRRGRRDN